MAVNPSEGNEGLKNLQGLMSRMLKAGLKEDKSVPIVLVSGFSGWGEPLLGTFNYWGGFENLAAVSQASGYTVLVVQIGPLSSNWERACEVYAQLTTTTFSEPDKPPKSIPVDYGVKYSDLEYFEKEPTTKAAVLYGSLPNGWEWGYTNPLHFICHSQGGNTIRLLIEMLKGTHSEMHPAYFLSNSRQNWVKSVVTLGTPHKGSTIIDVVRGLLPKDTLDLITRLIVSVSFQKPRVYDLQLDHWGFSRIDHEDGNGQNTGPETFIQMHTRLLPIVKRWWEGIRDEPPQNGFYENSIEGVQALNIFAPTPSPHTFYFTMSFDATTSFPEATLTREDLASFPLIFPLSHIPDPLNFFSGLGAGSVRILSKFPGVPNIVSLAKWAVQVLNNHLGPLGYFNKIPTPGPRVPRSDMLPLLAVTAYGMGGLESQLSPNISAEELQHNDGIVNTASMRGPDDSLVSNGADFPIFMLRDRVTAAPARGVYWHMGINETIDHADEIGVFTVGKTYEEVKLMYELFAQLLTRLP